MMREDVPIDDQTFEVLRFLSGHGWWLLIAIALVFLFIYKKTKQK